MKNTKPRKVKIILILMTGLIAFLVVTFLIFKDNLANLFLNKNELYIREQIETVSDITSHHISVKDIRMYHATDADKLTDEQVATATDVLYLITNDDLQIHIDDSTHCYEYFTDNGFGSPQNDHRYYAMSEVYYFSGTRSLFDKYNLTNTANADYEIHTFETDKTDSLERSRDIYLQMDYKEITDFSLWKIKLFS
jgi:hypothetical protein